MASPTKLLAAQQARPLGRDASVLTIGEETKSPGAWAGKRFLSVSGRPAFKLSFWCGTCPLPFERLKRLERHPVSRASAGHLDEGLSEIDEDVVGAFSELLPTGEYIPQLLEIERTLTFPMKPGDHFAEEQDKTWRTSDGFWGLPEYPRTPYYRRDTRALDDENALFESVVPMVPPAWNDRQRVEEHAEQLRHSTRPTCVTLSLLDVRQRAVASR